MLTLRRSIRFAIPPGGSSADISKTPNSYAANPSPQGFDHHFEIALTCKGEPDPMLGYLLDIKVIDEAARHTAIHILRDAIAKQRQPISIIHPLLAAISPRLDHKLIALRLNLNPFCSLEASTSMPTTVLMRQRFDFAASHRLHVPSLSPEENRKAFGKCNHESGHGHNYQFEPCIAVDVSTAAPAFTLQHLESIVEEVLIQHYDHKHLTIDTPEFNPEKGGVNSSVENISRVFFEKIAPHIAAAGARLHSIRVWETDRTSAEYSA